MQQASYEGLLLGIGCLQEPIAFMIKGMDTILYSSTSIYEVFSGHFLLACMGMERRYASGMYLLLSLGVLDSL